MEDRIIPMGDFGRKNLIQTGFIAGMRFCGIEKNVLMNEYPELYERMIESIGKTFEEFGMSSEIEF